MGLPDFYNNILGYAQNIVTVNSLNINNNITSEVLRYDGRGILVADQVSVTGVGGLANMFVDIYVDSLLLFHFNLGYFLEYKSSAPHTLGHLALFQDAVGWDFYILPGIRFNNNIYIEIFNLSGAVVTASGRLVVGI